MYYAYLLQCADNTIYAGYTNDLSQRIEAHNIGFRAGASLDVRLGVFRHVHKFFSRNVSRHAHQ